MRYLFLPKGKVILPFLVVHIHLIKIFAIYWKNNWPNNLTNTYVSKGIKNLASQGPPVAVAPKPFCWSQTLTPSFFSCIYIILRLNPLHSSLPFLPKHSSIHQAYVSYDFSRNFWHPWMWLSVLQIVQNQTSSLFLTSCWSLIWNLYILAQNIYNLATHADGVPKSIVFLFICFFSSWTLRQVISPLKPLHIILNSVISGSGFHAAKDSVRGRCKY